MSEAIEAITDYIMSHESEDFLENLDDQPIEGRQKRLIIDWFNDDIGTTEEIKSIFQELAYQKQNSHIYASAICLAYGIAPKETP